MFDEHDLIRRAATECMCNMVLCDEVTLLNVLLPTTPQYKAPNPLNPLSPNSDQHQIHVNFFRSARSRMKIL